MILSTLQALDARVKDAADVSYVDGGYVALLDMMGGDEAVVRAAWQCTDKPQRGFHVSQFYGCGCEIRRGDLQVCPEHYIAKTNLPQDAIRTLHQTLTANPPHSSIFEHAHMRWWVRLPLFTASQWTRHRTGVFSMKSLRYTVAEDGWYTPRVNSKTQKAFTEDQISAWDDLMGEQYARYRNLLNEGYPPEQARGILGPCVWTEFEWTTDAWNLMHWLDVRQDRHAQMEMQEYARALCSIWQKVMPVTYWAWILRKGGNRD